MRDTTVSILIVNYNGKAFLSTCLNSALAQTYPISEILVIDNHSTDGSYEQAVREYASRIHIVRSESDLGYPGALNKAAGMCKGQYIVFLNDDAALHPKAIEELVNAASAYRRFDFFQPKILLADTPDIINSTGILIHYCGFGSLDEGGKRASQSNAVREISGVHGACFMSRADAFREVGSFDSSFFAFYEDTDLSWRALLRGKRIIYVPSALVYHKWGQAWGTLSSAKIRLAERNRLMMLLTNYDRGTLLLLFPLIVFTEVGEFVWLTRHHMTRAKILGYADLICLRTHLRSRRRMIKAMRRESDLALLRRFTSQLNQVRLGGPWLSPIRYIYRLFEIVVIRHL
jgi:GT2 family glycosyltransferase